MDVSYVKRGRMEVWEDGKAGPHFIYTSYLAVNNALYHLLSPGKERKYLDYVCLSIKMKYILSERNERREERRKISQLSVYCRALER